MVCFFVLMVDSDSVAAFGRGPDCKDSGVGIQAHVGTEPVIEVGVARLHPCLRAPCAAGLLFTFSKGFLHRAQEVPVSVTSSMKGPATSSLLGLPKNAVFFCKSRVLVGKCLESRGFWGPCVSPFPRGTIVVTKMTRPAAHPHDATQEY